MEVAEIDLQMTMVDMLHEVAETGDIEDKVDNHETGL